MIFEGEYFNVKNLIRKEENKLGVWDEHIHTTIYKVDNQQGPTL